MTMNSVVSSEYERSDYYRSKGINKIPKAYTMEEYTLL